MVAATRRPAAAGESYLGADSVLEGLSQHILESIRAKGYSPLLRFFKAFLKRYATITNTMLAYHLHTYFTQATNFSRIHFSFDVGDVIAMITTHGIVFIRSYTDCFALKSIKDCPTRIG